MTIENYVKAIYLICAEADGVSRNLEGTAADSNSNPPRPASTGALAEAMGVAPGTVTSMLKSLDEAGLAEYRPYEGVRLTAAGETLALRMLRRHRLIELFLVKTLGLAWDEVHEEAENMEHAVSDLLVDRMDQFLGFPQTDPHGDPIPRSDGSLPETTLQPLSTLGPEQPFCLARVLDQSGDFLRFLSDRGLALGAQGCVNCVDEQAETMTLQLPEQEVTLSLAVAAKILIENVPLAGDPAPSDAPDGALKREVRGSDS